VVTARKVLVRWSLPQGSPRKPECPATAAMASGCSDWSRSADRPPMNIEASPCTLLTGRSGPNQRGPGVPWMRARLSWPSGPATLEKMACPIRSRSTVPPSVSSPMARSALRAPAPAVGALPLRLPRSPAQPHRSGDVAPPVVHPAAGGAGHVHRAPARAVAAYLRAQADAVPQLRLGPARHVQQPPVQRSAGQFHVRSALARAGVLVVRSVDPAAHELQLVHVGRVASATDNRRPAGAVLSPPGRRRAPSTVPVPGPRSRRAGRPGR